MMKTTSLLIASGDAYAPSKRITNPLEPWNMNISCRIANADTQCGRITNPPERNIEYNKQSYDINLNKVNRRSPDAHIRIR
jgi:hypothetical protein